MSYQTLEVDLENGMVRPRGVERLPSKARALLTIVEENEVPAANLARTLGDAMRDLNVTSTSDSTDLSSNKQHLEDLGL